MTKSHAPGATGRRVADNVADLRRRAGLSRAQLAAKLDAIGRPLSGTVIQKIENGVRPVDVDDLMCLAVALDVTPLRLLFGDTETEINITPTWTAATTVARLWAQGADYLGGDSEQARRIRELVAELHDAVTGKGQDGKH
jgi:transcriptional regulator with XRE-family HTH domain